MKTPWHEREQDKRAGFSLVEVTLALLVVAIGLTATFALFPEGLRATRAAVDDTEISMFAEYVFTTLDLTVGKYGGDYVTDWDIADTDDFISLMLSDAAPDDKYQLKDGGGVETFYWIPDFYGLWAGDFAGTELSAQDFEDAEFWTSAFTYTLDIGRKGGGGGGVTTYALLKVWPGEYGGATPSGEPRIFYREILPIR
jgi:prepilin-type N-terminal cleavage/methylation domain-containing protein